MHVGFRADASLRIGTGHVMRCRTLAQKLREMGVNCAFICVTSPGNLIHKLVEDRFLCYPVDPLKSGPLSESVGQEDQVLDIVRHAKFDWVVVDHYELDAVWEKRITDLGAKVCVIDDLADRKHQCDLLLDQTFGRLKEDYRDLIPPECEMLLGSRYALLRGEFVRERQHSIKGRRLGPVKEILVSMGGGDPKNSTLAVVRALNQIDRYERMNVTVILGQNYGNKADLLLAIGDRSNYRIVEDTNAISKYMCRADLAIAGGGTTTWERLCLGLPSLFVNLAQNQDTIINNVVRSGGGYLLDTSTDHSLLSSLSNHLKKFAEKPELLQNMAVSAHGMVDGRGSERVAVRMLGVSEK